MERINITLPHELSYKLRNDAKSKSIGINDLIQKILCDHYEVKVVEEQKEWMKFFNLNINHLWLSMRKEDCLRNEYVNAIGIEWSDLTLYDFFKYVHSIIDERGFGYVENELLKIPGFGRRSLLGFSGAILEAIHRECPLIQEYTDYKDEWDCLSRIDDYIRANKLIS
jgi:hypothetical protein